jgi:dihydroflavonol-4-reductase
MPRILGTARPLLALANGSRHMKYLVTGATGLLGNNIVRELLGPRRSGTRAGPRCQSDPRPLEGLPVERTPGETFAIARRSCGLAKASTSSCTAAGHVHIGWTQTGSCAGHQRRRYAKHRRRRPTSGGAPGSRLDDQRLGPGPAGRAADEDSALPGSVECPYVVTKREAEQVVLDEVGRGLWATIVNPSTMFGPWDWKPSSGKMILEVTRFAPFAPLGAGNFCDARDVAAGDCRSRARRTPVRRYVLGGYNLTFWDAWRKIAQLAGKPGPRLPMGPIVRAFGGPACTLMTWLTGHEGAANTAAMAMGRQQHCFLQRAGKAQAGLHHPPARTRRWPIRLGLVPRAWLRSLTAAAGSRLCAPQRRG